MDELENKVSFTIPYESRVTLNFLGETKEENWGVILDSKQLKQAIWNQILENYKNELLNN